MLAGESSEPQCRHSNEGISAPRKSFLIPPPEDQTLFNYVEVLYQDKAVF